MNFNELVEQHSKTYTVLHDGNAVLLERLAEHALTLPRESTKVAGDLKSIVITVSGYEILKGGNHHANLDIIVHYDIHFQNVKLTVGLSEPVDESLLSILEEVDTPLIGKPVNRIVERVDEVVKEYFSVPPVFKSTVATDDKSEQLYYFHVEVLREHAATSDMGSLEEFVIVAPNKESVINYHPFICRLPEMDTLFKDGVFSWEELAVICDTLEYHRSNGTISEEGQIVFEKLEECLSQYTTVKHGIQVVELGPVPKDKTYKKYEFIIAKGPGY